VSDTYSVAISYGEVLGWIDYDGAARSARVNLADEKGRTAVEAFLAAPHEVEMPHETLMDFTKETVTPLADRESFELALTPPPQPLGADAGGGCAGRAAVRWTM